MTTPALQRPAPSSPPAGDPRFTGMGWHWLHGKPTKPAPPVER